MLDAARPHLLRILGPNCIGALVPGAQLNASFSPGNAESGKRTFVTQSGALATAMLDWANRRGIDFAHFISLGDSADVDFDDVLDYLACDLAGWAGLDINPLPVDEHGVLALDTRVRLRPVPQGEVNRLAIRPYPSALAEQVPLAGSELLRDKMTRYLSARGTREVLRQIRSPELTRFYPTN